MDVRKVAEIHVVDRGGTNVENLSETRFDSGWWVVAEAHVQPGVVFALHEAKDQRSYLQGVVDRPPEKGTGERKGRVMVGFRRQGAPLPGREAAPAPRATSGKASTPPASSRSRSSLGHRMPAATAA